MPPGSHETMLIAEVNRFEESVRSVALAIVDAVVRKELQRRLDAVKESLAPRGRVARKRVASVTPTEAPIRQEAATDSKVGAQSQRRPVWTREAIVHELATWLASGTTIDAAFVSRHGPPGLVAATRKTFGRFEAALNVASLEVAKLYPEGPPSRRNALT